MKNGVRLKWNLINSACAKLNKSRVIEIYQLTFGILIYNEKNNNGGHDVLELLFVIGFYLILKDIFIDRTQ